MDKLFVFGLQFSTFVRSIKLVLEEKTLTYDSGTVYKGQSIEMHSPQHYTLHPFGKFPVLIHNGQVFAESIPICHYINEYFPGKHLAPSAIHERHLHEQWCSHIATSIDKIIVREHLLEIAFPRGEGKTIRRDKVEKAIPNTLYCLQKLSEQLGDKAFLCSNDFYIADALAAPIIDYVYRLPNGNRLLEKTPNLIDYRNRILDRASGNNILKIPETK